MQEGTLSAWLVADGEHVAEGQPLYVLEIDKSTTDIESPASGTLRHLKIAGNAYPVGEVIGEIIT